MNLKLLIDSIVRQTTVLIAQLATAQGVRAPLAHVANQVFLDLAQELNRQGVSRKVSADMFGLALRTYLRKLQRLDEGATDRGHSLWEAVLRHLQTKSGAVLLRTEVLSRFHRDDPELVRGVLSARRARGWYTTQENLYALVALTHYAKARAGKSANVRIARGDQVLLSERLTGEGLARLRRLEVPLDPSDTRPLTISTSEGTAHYRVRAVYQRDSAHQAAANKGLDVRRVFLDPETGAPIERAKEGQMVRVQLTLASPETQHHVALSDYLPAGLEPINARFATVPHNLPPDDRSWYDRLWLTHRELLDERVDAFVDWMPARSGSFEYLARATSVGTFVVPAATAEKMYDPDVNGRTALRSFEIVARSAR